MFYFLSKTAGYLLTPAGWLLTALVSALVFRRQRRRLLLLSLGLFWALGNSVLVNELARAWEIDVPAKDGPPWMWPPLSAADTATTVAVVLTGGLVDTQLPVVPARPLLGEQADRLGQALFLYKTGRVQKILISGGSSDLPFLAGETLPEGQQGMEFLRLAGVPARDLRWEMRSRNTRENALFSAQVLRSQYHTDRCVLVTSAFHLRRAVACFSRAGIRATPFPAAYIQQPRRFLPGDLLFPSDRAFADASRLIKEMAGYVAYALAGYV